MSFGMLTWQQVVLLLGSGALIVVAYKLAGPEAAGAVALATHALAASSGAR